MYLQLFKDQKIYALIYHPQEYEIIVLCHLGNNEQKHS